MSEIHLSIDPHDPIIARDARPFGLGIRMKSLDWPYPSVLAGSVRTMLGKMNGNGFDPVTVAKLKKVSVSGPLPLYNKNNIESLYLPAPLDIVVNDTDKNEPAVYPIRPSKTGDNEWCNLPDEKLLPAMIPESVGDDFKPAEIAQFWSLKKMAEWLAHDSPDSFKVPLKTKKGGKKVDPDSGYIDLPEKESRIHVQIKPDTGTSDEGRLFETIGLDFGAGDVRIAARVDTKDFIWKNSFHPIGGERRLAFWESGRDPGWECPGEITGALEGKKYARMILATPAVFSNGWLPGWLDKETLCGTPPGLPENIEQKFTLTLKSACVGRWKPLSGWDLQKKGPKPIRRLVPAGSVYFFEVTTGDPKDIAEKLWLRPVSDTIDDQNYSTDGFGLALWGVWNADDKMK
ncbi:type III-B CRISPR module-associated protein Cmr3 [Methanolacinia paynteri]|uniref:type III-B CRISPR module-associated protein Cmr3 n=1 Tax=Methanolacinia paynteri TaxID=230356 RepID=UPI00064EE1E5|nr:type III-B CRISPR module-associated protein Cmr3 [Methanolacinia paynteri]